MSEIKKSASNENSQTRETLDQVNPKSKIQNPKSIFLLGFMASGKSTVGPALAAKLCRSFVDLDLVIEAQARCAIASLIERVGEERFREIEAECLLETASGLPSVIAPGGGAITRAENRELMSQRGVTVWLDAPFDLCWRRIEQDPTVRPLAPNRELAQARYEQRLPLYRQASIQIAINQSQAPDEIAERIAQMISKLRV